MKFCFPFSFSKLYKSSIFAFLAFLLKEDEAHMQNLSRRPHNDPRQPLSRMVVAAVKPSDEQFGFFRLTCRLSRTTRDYRSTAVAKSGICVNSSNTTRCMSGAQTCMCQLAFSQASLDSSHIWFPWMGKEQGINI